MTSSVLICQCLFVPSPLYAILNLDFDAIIPLYFYNTDRALDYYSNIGSFDFVLAVLIKMFSFGTSFCHRNKVNVSYKHPFKTQFQG